jgi:hypothetical protein
LELSKQAIGRAGEFQAASIFERRGVVTTHVDVYGVDLWCETSSGRRVTVQVKSAQEPQPNYAQPNYDRHVTPRYHFNLRQRGDYSADVYCFVALDLSLLRLFSVGELTSQTKKISQSSFTGVAMEADIKRYLY